MNKAGCDDLFD